MPGNIPTDIHDVCEDHPEWEHDGSHTSKWQHLTDPANGHLEVAPVMRPAAPSVSYPPA
jgi:hypothetical protein